MKTISSALQAILDSRNFFMEDVYTITLVDGTVVRLTSGQQPILMAMGTFSEAEVTDDEQGRTITIDHTKISEDLTDFPVPVLINDADDPIFTNAGAEGYDIWFTDLDGNVLDYERAIWDPENHLALFYVKVPSVSSTEDTLFHMYYGDTVARTEDESNPAGVWDSNYAAVYHLVTDPSVNNYPPEAPTAVRLLDSTANNRDLGVGGSMLSSQLEGSALGRGWHFDGANDTVGTSTFPIGAVSELTIEFFFKSDSASTHQKLLYLASVDSGLWMHGTINADSTNNRVQFAAADTDGNKFWTVDGSDVTSDMHLAFTIVAGTSGEASGALNGYINGALVGSAVALKALAHNYINAMYMASNMGFDQFFDGLMSEVRFSTSARSAAWLAATYHGLMGTLLTIGDEETGEAE